MQKYISKLKVSLVGIAVILVAGIYISLNKDINIKSNISESPNESPRAQGENSTPPEGNITSGLAPSRNTIRSREEVLGHKPQVNSNFGGFADKQEMERFKEKTKEHTKVLYQQMRDDEIESLKKSIENDEKLLKEFEASGSNAQDYENIQNHLEKRKNRLKELSKFQ